MEDLKKFATEIALHTENMLEGLNYQFKDWNHQCKSRIGSTPYASKRKKKRKK